MKGLEKIEAVRKEPSLIWACLVKTLTHTNHNINLKQPHANQGLKSCNCIGHSQPNGQARRGGYDLRECSQRKSIGSPFCSIVGAEI